MRATPRRKRFRVLRRLLGLLVFLTLLAIAAYVYILAVYAPGLRSEARLIPSRVQAQLQQHDAQYVTLDAISPDLRHAIVAIEDRRFYYHPGIDPIGMVRAALVNLSARKVDQGGSTLEEQLVKRSLVADDGTLRSKLRRIVLAWAVDQEFSKRRILELYLNAAYYGQGAYGAGAAARIYFGTDSAHLTLAQSAFLAALPQAPSIYGANPTSAAVRYRQRKVLDGMVADNYITSEQEQTALNESLRFAFPNP